MTKKKDDFEKLLGKELKNKSVALSYLNEAYKDNDLNFFIKCIKDVIKANGGFTKLAKEAGVSRTSLYSAFSGRKTPTIHHVEKILHALGFSFSLVRIPKKTAHKKAA